MFDWYVVLAAFIVGFVIGAIVWASMFRKTLPIGTLNIFAPHPLDEEDGPYMFLELSTKLEEVAKMSEATVEIKYDHQ